MSLCDLRWIAIPSLEDARGVMSVLEGSTIPFPIRRIFYMRRVPPDTERGGHAHPHTHQILIPIAGELRLEVSDGARSETFVLNNPCRGLYVPQLTWARLFGFSSDSITLALCNTEYVRSDVIRDWNLFINRIAEVHP